MLSISPTRVVKGIGLARVAIGAVAMAVPRRIVVVPDSSAHDATLMTRSFAVREIVLGVGALLAGTRAGLGSLRAWALLGALTDGSDVAVAVANQRAGDRRAIVLLGIAATATTAELAAAITTR